MLKIDEDGMPLADHIRDLGVDSVTRLDAAHDHYIYTRKLWRLLEVDVVRYKRKFSLHNPQTGRKVSEHELIGLSRGYLLNNLPRATLDEFVSAFEVFIAELMSAWMLAHPASVKSQKVELAAVLAAGDLAAVQAAATRSAVERRVLDFMYKRPTDWFAAIGRMAHIAMPTGDDIDCFAEVKASRDVLVHNRGIANATYIEKAGKKARFASGDAIDLPDEYIHEGWQLLRMMVSELAANAATAAPA